MRPRPNLAVRVRPRLFFESESAACMPLGRAADCCRIPSCPLVLACVRMLACLRAYVRAGRVLQLGALDSNDLTLRASSLLLLLLDCHVN